MKQSLTHVVVGAGVVGLTTAICLAEAGVRVEVWAASIGDGTTSNAAGAMWGPYHAELAGRVEKWSAATLAVLRELASEAVSGVRFAAGTEAARGEAGPPAWAFQLDGFRMCDRGELPPGFATGWRYTAPLIEMPVYLRYLQQRLAAAGGTMQVRRLATLDEATREVPVVVNCTGMGARDLVPDPGLFPVRGQLVVVANPGIAEFFTEDTGSSPELLHWYPFGDTLVLGGTAHPDAWGVEPDPAIAAAIIDRCAEIEPRLRRATVLAHRVGFRPTRPTVRVEEQSGDRARIVHNYGHGGAGVTLSWGCAAEVARILLTSHRRTAY